MFIFDEWFLRSLAGVAMGGFEVEKKEWNNFQDNPLNLGGGRQMGKEREDYWEWQNEILLRPE